MHVRLMVLLVLALAASACQVRIEQATLIDEDGSGTVVLDVLLDEELRTLTGFADAASALELAGGIPEGFEVEDLVLGDFEGARAVRAFADLEELNAILGEAAGAGVANDVAVVKEGNEYRYTATVGDLGAAVDGAGINGLTPETFGEFFDIALSVGLPGEIVDHNADAVLPDGTLIWHLGIDDSGSTIFATSRVAIGWAPYAIGGILAVALAAGGAGWLARSRRTVRTDAPLSEVASESPSM